MPVAPAAGSKSTNTNTISSRRGDVLIIPNANTETPNGRPIDATRYGVLRDNFLFGQQWEAKDPAHRITLTVPILAQRAGLAALQQLVAVIKDAAVIAQGGKSITLFVGHGGTGSMEKHTQTAFDSMPQGGAFGDHSLLVTEDVLTLYPSIMGPYKPLNVSPSLGMRLEMVFWIGQLMKAQGVGLFRVLACNVAASVSPGGLNGARFVQWLATFLGIPAACYDGYVATQPITANPPSARIQIWITHDHDHPLSDAPASTSPGDPSFTEIPLRGQLVEQPGSLGSLP